MSDDKQYQKNPAKCYQIYLSISFVQNIFFFIFFALFSIFHINVLNVIHKKVFRVKGHYSICIFLHFPAFDLSLMIIWERRPPANINQLISNAVQTSKPAKYLENTFLSLPNWKPNAYFKHYFHWKNVPYPPAKSQN